MATLVDLEAVQDRLDFDLSEEEERAVETQLSDLSDEARYHAGQVWEAPEDAPNIVKNTIARAVTRWARNMNGYVTSKAGDETVSWTDLGEEAGNAEFTKDEISKLKNVGSGKTGAAGSGFGTITVVAYGPRYGANLGWDGRVPIQGCPETFPFYNPETGGW